MIQFDCRSWRRHAITCCLWRVPRSELLSERSICGISDNVEDRPKLSDASISQPHQAHLFQGQGYSGGRRVRCCTFAVALLIANALLWKRSIRTSRSGRNFLIGLADIAPRLLVVTNMPPRSTSPPITEISNLVTRLDVGFDHQRDFLPLPSSLSRESHGKNACNCLKIPTSGSAPTKWTPLAPNNPILC